MVNGVSQCVKQEIVKVQYWETSDLNDTVAQRCLKNFLIPDLLISLGFAKEFRMNYYFSQVNVNWILGKYVTLFKTKCLVPHLVLFWQAFYFTRNWLKPNSFDIILIFGYFKG